MYSAEDLDSINQAILKLGQGKQVVRITHKTATGSETIEYNPTDLSELRKLRDEIALSFGRGLNHFCVSTHKSL